MVSLDVALRTAGAQVESKTDERSNGWRDAISGFQTYGIVYPQLDETRRYLSGNTSVRAEGTRDCITMVQHLTSAPPRTPEDPTGGWPQ